MWITVSLSGSNFPGSNQLCRLLLRAVYAMCVCMYVYGVIVRCLSSNVVEQPMPSALVSILLSRLFDEKCNGWLGTDCEVYPHTELTICSWHMLVCVLRRRHATDAACGVRHAVICYSMPSWQLVLPEPIAPAIPKDCRPPGTKALLALCVAFLTIAV